MKTALTNAVARNPIMAVIISTIAHKSDGFKYDSSIFTQSVLPVRGLLATPHA